MGKIERVSLPDLIAKSLNNRYEILSVVGSGTYGCVYKAKRVDGASSRLFALKKIDTSKETEGFPITALREIAILQRLQHPNIVSLEEVITGKGFASKFYSENIMEKQTKSTYLVFEYVDHSLKGMLEAKVTLPLPALKSLISQLLKGVAYLHSQKIIHRDLKCANILYSNQGIVKIADFGLAREETGRMYTTRVVTLWYRAPELLLGTRQYSSKIDVWALGCVFAELFTGEPLFRGDTEARQLEILFSQLGTDLETQWPEAKSLPLFAELGPKRPSACVLPSMLREKRVDEASVEFIGSCLKYDPAKRPEAQEALLHPFFSSVPLPCPNSEMPKIHSELHGYCPQKHRVPKKEYTLKASISVTHGVPHERDRGNHHHHGGGNNSQTKRKLDSREREKDVLSKRVKEFTQV